jgi:hypothetical protein
MSADIGRISTGQPPAGIKPAPIPTPIPVVPPPAPVPPPISIPESTGGSGIGQKILYGILVLGLLGALWWLASVFIGGQSSEPTPTPTPTSSATLMPTVKSLSSYFQQATTGIELKGADAARTDFLNAFDTAQPATQQAIRLPVTGTTATTMADFIQLTTGQMPDGVRSTLGQDWAALVYGQKEQFDQNGNSITNSPGNRLILIGVVSDISAASQAMTAWESATPVSLAQQLAQLFEVDATKSIVTGFSTGTYRNIPVHYWNFPYADRSIEWAVMTASNNKNYLLLAGSREAMFFAIDQLMQ